MSKFKDRIAVYPQGLPMDTHSYLGYKFPCPFEAEKSEIKDVFEVVSNHLKRYYDIPLGDFYNEQLITEALAIANEEQDTNFISWEEFVHAVMLLEISNEGWEGLPYGILKPLMNKLVIREYFTRHYEVR